MDLCQSKRGVLIDMKYLDDVRVDLHYALRERCRWCSMGSSSLPR